MKLFLLTVACLTLLTIPSRSESRRSVGKFKEVFSWRQLTFEINGIPVTEDQFSESNLAGGDKTGTDNIHFNNNDDEKELNQNNPIDTPSPAPIDPNDELGRFFIQYNNVPMGVEKVGNRLFVTIPRRRYGIPATLNYIDLSVHCNTRSPPLTPYPDWASSRSLISVYRTRADECGRLWTVDTGAIEIPNNPHYLQPPAIVVFDLKTDKQILRYQFKKSDLPAVNTPTGLASINVAIKNGDCSDAYAFISDEVSFGIIVFSLKQNDSWRQHHNYFSFNPTSGNLLVAGQSFTWNDGVFSVALGQEGPDGCRPTYFHPMISTQEFSVSSCELEKREANQTAYSVLGDRGTNSQCTMHDLHSPTNVMFFAEVGRDSVSCWNTEKPLWPGNMELLAHDNQAFSYPSDLHVTDDEVWVMANTYPRFIYSRLDTNEYNFFIYRPSNVMKSNPSRYQRCLTVSSKLKLTALAKPLRQEQLKPQESYILDTVSGSVYVWTGKQSTEREKTEAMAKAQALLSAKNYPSWVHVVKIIQGTEPAVFKQYFSTWRDPGKSR